MKVLLMILSALLFSATATAKYEVPKDAVIKVYDSKGKLIGNMSRTEYKVVKIEKKKPVVKTVKAKQKKSYSVILHAGGGKDGLKRGYSQGEHTIRQDTKPVGGATLCANQTDGPYGLCVNAFTNETFTIGIKRDFEL